MHVRARLPAEETRAAQRRPHGHHGRGPAPAQAPPVPPVPRRRHARRGARAYCKTRVPCRTLQWPSSQCWHCNAPAGGPHPTRHTPHCCIARSTPMSDALHAWLGETALHEFSVRCWRVARQKSRADRCSLQAGAGAVLAAYPLAIPAAEPSVAGMKRKCVTVDDDADIMALVRRVKERSAARAAAADAASTHASALRADDAAAAPLDAEQPSEEWQQLVAVRAICAAPLTRLAHR